MEIATTLPFTLDPLCTRISQIQEEEAKPFAAVQPAQITTESHIPTVRVAQSSLVNFYTVMRTITLN